MGIDYQDQVYVLAYIGYGPLANYCTHSRPYEMARLFLDSEWFGLTAFLDRLFYVLDDKGYWKLEPL